MGLRVILEVAPKRSFASALDWPGWSRGAKTEEAAVEALLAYAPRYAAVAKRAKEAFPSRHSVEVVERLEGNASTEFGVPALAASAEDDPLTSAELKRLVALLKAAWATFDAAARAAKGVELRLGPRGGGRQLPKIVEHVRGADGGYLNQLGSKPAAVEDLRATFIEALTARANDRPVPNPNNVRKPWSPRYAARRSAWHALDHAWEIEDRAGPEPRR
jgi:hypothetical protein